MSHYNVFLEEVKKRSKKNPVGLFTPYQSPKDVARQLVAPVVTPMAISLMAGLDALYASFYLMKGLGHAITLNPSKAASSLSACGNHFGGFLLAATLAVTAALIEFVAIFTRAAASCKKTDHTTDVNLDAVNISCCM